MEKVEDVQIIDSLVVDKDDFLSAYILSEESGTLDSYKRFFRTNEPVSSTVYKNRRKATRFTMLIRQTATVIAFLPSPCLWTNGGRETITDEHQQQ